MRRAKHIQARIQSGHEQRGRYAELRTISFKVPGLKQWTQSDNEIAVILSRADGERISFYLRTLIVSPRARNPGTVRDHVRLRSVQALRLSQGDKLSLRAP